jgi:hypothetical protein
MPGPCATSLVRVVQRLALAARIEREPSGRIRSRRRIGTSGIALNVVEVMFY